MRDKMGQYSLFTIKLTIMTFKSSFDSTFFKNVQLNLSFDSWPISKISFSETLSFTPSPDRFLRLSRSHTLSSIRREHAYFDPQVPKDSLDFTIKARYNPWQFNAPKNVTKVQVKSRHIW